MPLVPSSAPPGSPKMGTRFDRIVPDGYPRRDVVCVGLNSSVRSKSTAGRCENKSFKSLQKMKSSNIILLCYSWFSPLMPSGASGIIKIGAVNEQSTVHHCDRLDGSMHNMHPAFSILPPEPPCLPARPLRPTSAVLGVVGLVRK